MSDRVPDAEKRLRMAIGTPATSDEDHPVNNELEWKNGRGAYITFPGPSWATWATWPPVVANRPCVQRTALGIPVDPDVKIKRKRSSGRTSLVRGEACEGSKLA